jgi:predicted ATPase
VLSGTNGSGKSSVIQSLLALRQSWEQGLLARNVLALNGDWIRLGTGRDVLNEDAERDHIELELEHDAGVSAWRFAYAAREELEGALPATPLPELALFRDDFQYLCAERSGPRSSFAMVDHLVRNQRFLGAAGQYTAQFLAELGEEPVRPGPLMRTDAEPSLLKQTAAWLDLVAAGPRLYVQTFRDMDVVQLQFAFSHRLGETMRYRPTNVGFGLTYTLPVIVALLSARPGGLVIVENPEAHLHPQGQADMGRMLALAAASGVQVLVETHSDHVLNGIRIAVKQALLSHEELALHFFTWQRNGRESQHVHRSPRMNAQGRLDHWPEGFFDQWERSLDQLLD